MRTHFRPGPAFRLKYLGGASTVVEFDVVIERDESGAFIAHVPVLPGCHSWGATKDDALKNVREAIELYLEEQGKPTSRIVAIEKVSVGA